MFRLAFFCNGIQESFLFDSNYANRIIVKTGMKKQPPASVRAGGCQHWSAKPENDAGIAAGLRDGYFT